MKLVIAAPIPTEPEPILQRIEVATARSIPTFHIIGLPAPEVAEARERVRAAIESSDLEFPKRRVLINLSPASIRKRGTGLDLGMALAVIQAMKKNEDPGPTIAAWGELGLDGSVKPVGYALRVYSSAWKAGVRALVCSQDDLFSLERARALLQESGAFASEPPVLLAASHLKEAIRLCNGFTRGRVSESASHFSTSHDHKSLEEADRRLLPLSPALERVVAISAAGLHHLLILGPRGVGKSHALDWRASLEPEIGYRANLERMMLVELSNPNAEPPPLRAPIRRVGAQVRPQALYGHITRTSVRPGECSLAHGGLLLADELPEWPRDARESLREPLESRKVRLTRINGTVELPASFTLIANGNLCPCGGWPKDKLSPPSGTAIAGSRRSTSSRYLCDCKAASRSAYLHRLSGPILDRIDLICQLLPDTMPVSGAPSSRPLKALRERVEIARGALNRRWGVAPGQLSAHELEQIFSDHPEAFAPLLEARAPNLRFRHKIARVALTLAEWDGLEDGLPGIEHFTEAACYRVMPT